MEFKRFQIYFVGNHKEIEKKTVFKHLDTLDISWLWITAKLLSDKGFSVMINKDQTVLYVDSGNFKQT